MVRNGSPVGGVVQVDCNIASGPNQLGRMKIAVIGDRISWQIAVLRHATEAVIWSPRPKCRPSPGDRAAFIIARFVVPVGLEILHVRSMGVKAEAHVMGDLAMLRPDLYRGDPRIFFESGRDSDRNPF